jgi:predicted kinase
MMCGLPGSGKSWLAAQLVTEMSGVTLRSDMERKRLAGLDALSRSDSQGGGGLYGADRVALVYRRLMHCAAAVLEGRRSVIVDANFGQREQRAELAELCHARGVPLVVVECHAPLPLLRQRIAARLARAHDPSEADLQVLEVQIGAREPIGSAEGLTVITADTSDADVVPRVRDRLNRAARLQIQ